MYVSNRVIQHRLLRGNQIKQHAIENNIMRIAKLPLILK